MNCTLTQMVLGMVIAYIAGALPLGYWWSKWATGGRDLRSQGSGNIGASNALRTCGFLYFVGVLLFDVTKTVAGLWLALYLVGDTAPDWYPFAAAAVVLCGNVWSICLAGCGGRGVATLLGVLVALYSWQVLLAFVLMWATLAMVSCRPFIASLCATITALGMQCWLDAGLALAGWWLMVALMLVLFTHRNHLADFIKCFVRPCLWDRWFGGK